MTDDVRARLDHIRALHRDHALPCTHEERGLLLDHIDRLTAEQPTRRVRLDVQCELGHHLGTWYDTIDEKYPFYCETCDDYVRDGRYPWKLTATIEDWP